MGRKATVVRTETTTDDAEGSEKPDENEGVALFTDLGSTDDDRIEKLTVTREDPDEGYLGVLPPNATETDVATQWGGSKYTIVAKNARGRIVTRRTIKLGGEPIFMSEVAEMRWRRANGLKPKKAETGETSDGAYSAKELMAIIEAKAEAARVESETREEKRRREDVERDEKIRKDEREWRANMERERADREARVRQEEREHNARMEQQRREDDKQRQDRIREDEARREKDHERQMQATLAAAKESQEKNQQFFTNMLAMTKAGDKAAANPMEQVTQILTIVEALKGAAGGEPQDAVTALLARLPETLQAAGGMVGSAIREAKGLPPQGQGAGGQETEAGDEGGAMEPGAIKLTGAVAAKTRELITHLLQKGQDPEKVLVAVADHLMGKRPGQAVQAANQAARARVEGKKGKGKPARRRRPAKAAGAPAKAPVAKVPAPAPKPPGAP